MMMAVPNNLIAAPLRFEVLQNAVEDARHFRVAVPSYLVVDEDVRVLGVRRDISPSVRIEADGPGNHLVAARRPIEVHRPIAGLDELSEFWLRRDRGGSIRQSIIPRTEDHRVRKVDTRRARSDSPPCRSGNSDSGAPMRNC